jgi:signal transduction histidine kinase
MEMQAGRILVIDDDLQVGATTVKILEKQGHRVRFFANGADALAYFREDCCDLVLSDVKMPGMDGVELLGLIRQRDPDVPVILMTAYADLDMVLAAIKQGAFDFVIKPFDPYGLMASIDRGVEFRRLCRLEKEQAVRLAEALAEKTRELQELHAQLVFSDKMATIGQLMAGIVHEINTPVGYVGTNLESLARYSGRLIGFITYLQSLAERYLPAEELLELGRHRKREKVDLVIGDCQNLIGESLEGIARVRKIILDLKTFSRREGDAAESLDVNQTIESVISIVWNEIKYVAELRREFSETAPVWGSSQKLGQVFLNLLVNASHAIDGYGIITVRTWQEGGDVCVSFTDTGCGITDDVLPHIFEPFYTTKEAGRGTGLGLSISEDIVRKHGGSIQVRSEPGRGSTFTVRLPARKGE